VYRDYPFAASEAAILPDLGPISRASEHSDENAGVRTQKPAPSSSKESCGGRLCVTRRSTNRPLVRIVMFFALSRHSTTLQQRRWHTKPLDSLNDRCKQVTRHSRLRHLKSHVPGMPDDLRSDLDQLLPQFGQRPVLRPTVPRRQVPAALQIRRACRQRGLASAPHNPRPPQIALRT